MLLKRFRGNEEDFKRRNRALRNTYTERNILQSIEPVVRIYNTRECSINPAKTFGAPITR